ncbi:DNA polymerase III subunit beta [Patescibacteria group bacterium]|nr:DNA polymerase III subunit beta [Patescibacteria group bacterium]
MKLVILKNNLREGLTAIDRAAGEHANLPILKNVLVKTADNKIRLSATNLEIAASRSVSGKIVEEGSITVPLATLLTIVNNTASERITLETDQNTLFFKTDNYEATIQGLPEEEFPIIPKIENKKEYLSFSADVLRDAVLKILSTIQVSEIRPEIGGMLFDFEITYLKFAGTDSFRLAEKTITETNFTSTFTRGFKVIVPLKTMQEVLRIMVKGEVTIFIDPNQILFQGEDTEIISRLIEGTYPEYDAITPKSFETEMTIEREHLMNAVKLVSTFSGKVNEIKMKLHDGKKVLEVYSMNQALGENKYLVPVKAKGESFETAFNWRYVMEGLKNFESAEVFFGVNGSHRAALLKNPSDASYFYIVMPINMN